MTARTLLAVYFSYVAVSYFFFYLYLPTKFLNFFIINQNTVNYEKIISIISGTYMCNDS
jgi:hypothetical protein